MTIFISSDYHHCHGNVIDFCSRPTNREEHEYWLIKQTNSVVKPEDTVYHLGDFSFTNDKSIIKNFCNKLNGNWYHLIGNHDNVNRLSDAFEGTRHKIIGNYHELKYNGSFIVMCHYPFESWNKMRYGSYHFFGHLHSYENFKKLKDIKNRRIVCLDSHENFIPYKLDDLLKKED